MRYIVLIVDEGGGGVLSATHAYAPPGGGWIDFDSARAWAENYIDTKGWNYQVLALEPAPG